MKCLTILSQIIWYSKKWTLQYDNVLGHTFQTVLINHIHLVLLLRKDRYHIMRNDWIDIWNTEYIIEATTIFHPQVEFCKQIVTATEYPTNLVATSPHKAADNVCHSDVCSCTFLRRTTVTHKGIQHSGENSNSTQAVQNYNNTMDITIELAILCHGMYTLLFCFKGILQNKGRTVHCYNQNHYCVLAPWAPQLFVFQLAFNWIHESGRVA